LRLVAAYALKGRWQLATIDLATGAFAPVATDLEPADSLAATHTHAVMVGGSARQPDGVLRVDLATGAVETIRAASTFQSAERDVSIAEAIEFATGEGLAAHAFFYPPQNSRFTAPPGERPPLIVFTHGGPTGATHARLNLEVQYWTSRGFAVADVNYTMGVFGYVVFVGDQDNRVSLGVQLVHKGHYFITGLGIEIAGRLIGQDDGRTIYQGARDRDSLALAAGEFVGLVHHPGFEINFAQRFFGAANALFRRRAVINQRKLDIVQSCRTSQQVERLEDEADLLVTDSCEFIIVKFTYQMSVEPVLATAWSVQTSDQVH